jgi:hypothetical protein
MPLVRQFVTGLLPPRPGFMPGSFRVRFMVDKVTLGQVFLPSYLVFHCQYHSAVALHTLILSGGWTIGLLVAAVTVNMVHYSQKQHATCLSIII